ncbi:MAG: hypothetical protein E6J30_03290 [Chloroflexi bacterium]|nr:MAG: hypothetical protein E6J30_03290 [Chloroflexota bacterium]
MRAAALAALAIVLAACSTPSAPAVAFTCADASGGTPGNVHITDVRVSQEPGFDRFVIQFDGTVPAFTVKRQAKPVFSQGGSGQTITLSGTAGILVQLHTATQAGTYSGSTDFTQADFRVLKEARLTEDFEGYVGWDWASARPRACGFSRPRPALRA